MNVRLRHFLLLFVPFIGLLGLLPHALFSADLGEWRYMANAWDEDTYALSSLLGQRELYRLLSFSIFRLFHHTWNLDTAMILMDVLPPMLTATLAALITYYAGFRSMAGLFLGSCLLLFALALMALCSTALVGNHLAQLLPFSSMQYPDWFRMFVANTYEAFFNLFKSPEPQISMVVQFASLLFMLRHAQTGQHRYTVALALTALAYPFIYITTAIALVICMACYALLASWCSKSRRPLWLLAIAIGSVLLAFYWQSQQPSSSSASVFIYHSRLPILSASLLWAIMLASLLAARWGRALFSAAQRQNIPAPVVLAAACCLVPAITLNQQILTGTMIQSRSWDYYTNMPFMAFAVLLLWPVILQVCQPLQRRAAPYVPNANWIAAGLAVWLCVGQYRVYDTYNRGNLENIAAARGLSELLAQQPRTRVLLETMGDDSQVALRMGDTSLATIAGYRQTMQNFAAPLSAGEQAHAASIARIKEQAFTYFDRRGLTPAALEQAMTEEAKRANGGAHILYFFSLLDCWRPASDHRMQNIDGMLKKIPQLIADYEAFLNDPARRLKDDIFYVTNTKRPNSERAWDESLVSQQTAGRWHPVTVYIYQQR